MDFKIEMLGNEIKIEVENYNKYIKFLTTSKTKTEYHLCIQNKVLDGQAPLPVYKLFDGGPLSKMQVDTYDEIHLINEEGNVFRKYFIERKVEGLTFHAKMIKTV